MGSVHPPASSASPLTGLDAPPSPEAQACACVELLRQVCSHLGQPTHLADALLDTEVLTLEEIAIAMRLNAQNQQLDFYADCGIVRACDEGDLYRHLLEDALSNDLPALSFGLHPQSRHVVARGNLYLPAVDAEGWLCTALLLAMVERARALRSRFFLQSRQS